MCATCRLYELNGGTGSIVALAVDSVNTSSRSMNRATRVLTREPEGPWPLGRKLLLMRLPACYDRGREEAHGGTHVLCFGPSGRHG